MNTVAMRLMQLLPLAERQAALKPGPRRLHQLILNELAEQGGLPSVQAMQDALKGEALDQTLRELADNDLLVLDATGHVVVGAYPFSLTPTSHRLEIDGFSLYAMCALDAVSVAVVFAKEVTIHSRCHVTGELIEIRQWYEKLMEVKPSAEVQIGIRWRSVDQHAACSLCLQMVFLKDYETARQWQGTDIENVSILSLDAAIQTGQQFFQPLLP